MTNGEIEHHASSAGEQHNADLQSIAPRVFHFSEDSNIGCFQPRPAKANHRTISAPVVWAVGERGAWSYHVPRHCPRVMFWATPDSSAEDVERLLGGDPSARVLAIEAAWLERCCAVQLFRYELQPDHFFLYDAPAHYYLSHGEECPLAMTRIAQPLAALAGMNVEVRLLAELWDVRERAFHSTLGWSFIRMGNAAAPARGYAAYLPL